MTKKKNSKPTPTGQRALGRTGARHLRESSKQTSESLLSEEFETKLKMTGRQHRIEMRGTSSCRQSSRWRAARLPKAGIAIRGAGDGRVHRGHQQKAEEKPQMSRRQDTEEESHRRPSRGTGVGCIASEPIADTPDHLGERNWWGPAPAPAPTTPEGDG